MVNRRDFLKASAATLPAILLSPGDKAQADVVPVNRRGGEDYSDLSGAKRRAVPTICDLCTARCPAIGYVENDRVVKIEGNPNSLRTRGTFCPRGQASITQVYDPDRILYPLRRTGKRGDGKWQRITWDEALDDLGGRLARLRADGRSEHFMFQHRGASASARALLGKFLSSYGTGTVENCDDWNSSAKRAALELTWGGYEDSWDPENARFILNLGDNFLEAGPNHPALVNRLAPRLADGSVKMITVDVRLSNTAARSHRWIPIRPGTDLALTLALCHVVMADSLYKGDGEDFLRFCKVTSDPHESTTGKIAALNGHLAPYTPDWAEKITGIAAAAIRELAVQFATNKPACIVSGRGASAHYNGVETERAIQMLAAITGNIDRPGSRSPAALPQWTVPPVDYPETSTGIRPRALASSDRTDRRSALSGQGTGQKLLRQLRGAGDGGPKVYMWYGQNPAYSEPDTERTIAMLKDESFLPFTVAVSAFYDESAALADLILPDATYLERWDWEERPSPDQSVEYSIRQPLLPPRGEARDFKNVCADLARRLDIPLGIESARAFVEAACRVTPEVWKNGGFADMVKWGILRSENTHPRYHRYSIPVPEDVIRRPSVILDDATSIYWDWTQTGAASETEARERGYEGTAYAFTGYVGQRIDGAAYAGFRPGALNKSGLFEIFSVVAESSELGALPAYQEIPEHAAMAKSELVLTTFRSSIQAEPEGQNCKWLAEIEHDNPAWINPAEAAARGIADGDLIRIRSPIGEIETTAKVTGLVAPDVVAIAEHAGHWEFGRYASGNRAPFADYEAPDERFKWWRHHGVPVNRIIPNSVEPASGQQRWMDTVVTVSGL